MSFFAEFWEVLAYWGAAIVRASKAGVQWALGQGLLLTIALLIGALVCGVIYAMRQPDAVTNVRVAVLNFLIAGCGGIAVGLFFIFVVFLLRDAPQQIKERDQLIASTSPRGYEDGLIRRTKQLSLSDREGLSTALRSVSDAYDKAKVTQELFNQAMHLLVVGIDNGRIVDAIPANIGRLQALRNALESAEMAMNDAVAKNHYYSEQVGYIAMVGLMRFSDYRSVIGQMQGALQQWSAIQNKSDPGMTTLLNGNLFLLRQEGAQFSGWINEGTRRLDKIKDANRAPP